MPDLTPRRRLIAAGTLLSLSIAASPLIVRWAYRDWNRDLVVGATAPALLVLGAVWLTVWQQRHPSSMLTFAPHPLANVSLLMTVWVVGTCLLGYWVALLGVAVIPIAAAYFALAWAQPSPAYRGPTAALGVATTPFLVWFAGRADEVMTEALIAGGTIVLIVVLLGLIRRQGRRTVDAAST